MPLIDRIARDGNLSSDERIGGHLFDSAVWLWLRGHLTKQNIVDAFNLNATDSTKLDEFQASFNGLNATQKIAFFGDFSASLILLQHGKITKGKFASIIGIS